MPLTDADIKVIIAAELKKAGFDKAKKATLDLDKTFKKLGKTIGISLSAAAIVSFGKQSLKAFADDEKAARRLTQTLSNMGLAFEDPRVKGFISNLEATSGVLDDQLRPAMQALLTTTGSVAKSQELLTLALDVAAGSGESVVTVADDLSKAYVGNTRALIKYNLGLSKTELTSKSFADIQKVISKQFSGQNAAYLETYAGKVSLLNVAFANAKETIGKGLADAFIQIAGDGGIGAAVDAMAEFSQRISDAIFGAGILIGKLNNIPTIGGRGLGEIIYASLGGGFIDALAKYGERQRIAPKPQINRAMSVTSATDFYTKQDRDRKKAEDAAAKRAKALAALQTKAAKDAAAKEKAAQALKRAGTIFDMENIQIVAALQGKVDEAQRLRLVALLALNTDNADAADKLTKAIVALQEPAIKSLGVTIQTADNAQTIIDKLVDAQTKLFLLNAGIANIPKAKSPFDEWLGVMATILSNLDTIAGKIRNMPVVSTGGVTAGGNLGVGGTTSNAPIAGGAYQVPVSPISPFPTLVDGTNVSRNPAITNLPKRTGDANASDLAPNVTVIVQGSVISEQDLAATITDYQYQFQRGGGDLRVSSIAV